MPKVMVMVPTYNERDNIEALITQILAQPLDAEIVVVDDNSPDGTGALVDAFAAREPRIHPLHRRTERGRASAGIAGFKFALARPDVSLVVEMDADFSHDPAHLPALVAAASEADVAIGSRYVPGGKQVNCTPRNVLFSRVINLVNWFVLGVHVHDASGGYKCYRRKALETIDLEHYVARAYSVGVETLLKCQKHGFTFKEIPITFVNRRLGQSKANLKVLVEYPTSVVKLWWRNLLGRVR
ncbi:MAG: polyprenol monophosphomannose synthase [Chloroflexi bacterium]|nr:polyprenol monophosphomannose synthase [Chloroflexota bacterium]